MTSPKSASAGSSVMDSTRVARSHIRSLTMLLAVSLFAMTGCIRLELGMVVNEDGSGVLNTLVAVSDTLTQTLGTSAEDVLDTSDLPMGSTVTEYQADGYTGFSIATTFADSAELDSLLGDSFTDVGSPTVSLEQDEADWRFAMVVPPFADQAGGGVPAGLLDDAWFRIRVTLPGEITEHNADLVEEGSLVWELDLAGTSSRELTANSTVAEESSGIDGALIFVLLVLLAFLAAAWVLVRRRGAATA